MNAGDLQWEEVAVYLEVAGEEVFPTLGDLAAWAQPQTYACKHAENLLAVTLNITGGSISVLVDDAENILSEDVAEMDALPEEIQALPFTLLSLVWTSDEFLFNPPRNFYPGNAMQDLLVSFPDAMIQMVSNSQYGFNQCIELSATNPEKTEERIDLTFYGVDTDDWSGCAGSDPIRNHCF